MTMVARLLLARRRVLGHGAALAGLAWAGSLATPGAAQGAALGATPTPAQTAGPFYPLTPPGETDTDLTRVSGRLAQGQIVTIRGRVLDSAGRPLAGARVEIWQANAFGRYHHPRDTASKIVDPNFQGFGVAVTAADGAYGFRTVKPAPYEVGADRMRTPHVHVRVIPPQGQPLGAELVSQMYFAGEALNEHDMILQTIRNPAQRAAVIVDFRPADGEPGVLSGRFDIVLGQPQ
jgi:protocatechuate 3,4-dioxygenase beta subunit